MEVESLRNRSLATCSRLGVLRCGDAGGLEGTAVERGGRPSSGEGESSPQILDRLASAGIATRRRPGDVERAGRSWVRVEREASRDAVRSELLLLEGVGLPRYLAGELVGGANAEEDGLRDDAEVLELGAAGLGENVGGVVEARWGAEEGGGSG
jgi:hypothetical protein